MLSSLKAAIESKKRALKQEDSSQAFVSNNQKKTTSTSKNAAQSADKDEEEEERAIRALNEKAKRYRQLETGETNMVPAGALIDFEQKLKRNLQFEDDQDADNEDDSHSRSMAAIPPPQCVALNKDRKQVAKEAIEDILNSINSSE